MVVDTDEVVLRATSRHLWVARCGQYPAGTIEEGRRYTALDLDGAVVARCRTLQAAGEALAGSAAPRPEAEPPISGRSTWWAGAAGVVGTPVVLLGAALSLLTQR